VLFIKNGQGDKLRNEIAIHATRKAEMRNVQENYAAESELKRQLVRKRGRI
jgi:hypothetical protein